MSVFCQARESASQTEVMLPRTGRNSSCKEPSTRMYSWAIATGIGLHCTEVEVSQSMGEALSPCLAPAAETLCTEMWVQMLPQLRALFPSLPPAPLLCPGTGHCCHRRQGRQEADPAVVVLRWVQAGLASSTALCKGALCPQRCWFCSADSFP